MLSLLLTRAFLPWAVGSIGNRRATGRLGALLEIALLAILTSGCASGRFSSDTQQAVRMDRLGDDARAVQIGREQSQYGQQLISSGRMRIDAGGEKIRRGERLVERGAGQVAQSRRAYESAVRETAADDSRLLRIRERWDEGIDFIRVGNALIGDGRRDVERGQLEVREGRTMIESAATLIRTVEQAYREPVGR